MLSDPGSMAFVYKDMRARFNITIRSTFLSQRSALQGTVPGRGDEGLRRKFAAEVGPVNSA